MNAPLIRPGSCDDTAEVQALERRSATRFAATPYPELAEGEATGADVLAARAATGDFLVAEIEGALAAFVIFRELEATAYIEQIDVDPPHAGRGLGAALLDAVAGAARGRGWTALSLSTFADVPWNAPYYRRLGFVDVADAGLTPGLLAVRATHISWGLDESRRVFLRRAI